MKKMFFFLVPFLMSFLHGQMLAQNNLLKNFSGIPVIAEYNWWFNGYPPRVDSMYNMGVNFITANYDADSRLSDLNTFNFNLYAINVKPHKVPTTLNHIMEYTDAKYSVWEAEDGVDTSYLYHDRSLFTTVPQGDSTYIKMNSTINTEKELLVGPYYLQEIYRTRYVGDSLIYDYIPYEADFRLKIIPNPYYDSTLIYSPFSDSNLVRLKITLRSRVIKILKL